MRTTVDLETDVLHDLKERAHRQKTSLKETLNAAIRIGLAQTGRSRQPTRYVCPTFALGRTVSAGINLDKALALAATLEEVEVGRELELRK